MSRRRTLSSATSARHNARFAVDPAGEDSALTPIPCVDLDEILCEREERQVGQDNCVSYRTLNCKSRRARCGRIFVKAQVKAHLYADGSNAVFHGPRCIRHYDDKGRLKDAA